MPKQKIDRAMLYQMLTDGKSPREVAQFFGVSEAAISKARKELNVAVVKSVALESAHKVVDVQFDTFAQLQKINEKANIILDRAIEERNNGIALKAMQEIRGQIVLQTEILKTLYDFQQTVEFQEQVLEELERFKPGLRLKFLEALKVKRMLRSSVRFSHRLPAR